MKVTVQCDGRGNNEIVFYTRVGPNVEKVSLPIMEIQGIKYRQMSVDKEVDDGFRYKIVSLLINGKDSISVKDIPLV